MPKQMKYVQAPGGGKTTTPIGSTTSKIGNRKDGRPVSQLSLAELERLATHENYRKHHNRIRKELIRRGS